MATTKKTTTNGKIDSNNKSVDTKTKTKPRGLWGLYEGKMFLNGTSNEVFNLGL